MATIPFKRRRIPYTFFNVNYVIMGITLAVFLVSLLNRYIPVYLALSIPGIESGFVWQFFTYFFTFLGDPGSNIFNVVFNLLALLFFGTQVEREMGSIQFLIFYVGIGLLSGLLGLGLFAILGESSAFIYGPSVTVFAVAVAFAAFYPDSLIYLLGIIPLRAALLVLIYVGIDVVMLLVSRGANNLIHLFGFGLSYFWMLLRYKRNVFRDLFS